MGSLFIYYSCTAYHCSRTVHALKNIKNGSHSTIHAFKNYFAILSVFSFSNNRLNPNGPHHLTLYSSFKYYHSPLIISSLILYYSNPKITYPNLGP